MTPEQIGQAFTQVGWLYSGCIAGKRGSKRRIPLLCATSEKVIQRLYKHLM